MDISLLEEIFFLTASVKEFTNSEQRESFKYKYWGIYLERFPELVLVAHEAQTILGYCLGSPVTDESFYPFQPHLTVFNELYKFFPAHLHINLHPDAQGLGIGQKLFGQWEALACQYAVGMHIMTSPAARNITFYRRLGLEQEFVRKFKGHDILLMGKNF